MVGVETNSITSQIFDIIIWERFIPMFRSNFSNRMLHRFYGVEETLPFLNTPMTLGNNSKELLW